ncbi:MAG: homocysteine S-methyltransferase family protein [Myxococcales bacterium]|nr:homocysteine S-methyltransferase family protein [Myxococcales bacterium]
MNIVLLDGPMGSELVRRGVEAPGRAWSANALDFAGGVIGRIHGDYVAAGATVHTANTFRTQRRAVGPRWEGLARRALRIARESVPAEHRVAASIAPVEDCYRPDLSPGAAARPEHAALARVLADAGADVLLCETFPNALEAEVAVEEAVRTGVETWVSLTAGPTASLMTPADMARAALRCARAGARAVLVNCTPAPATLAYVRPLVDLGLPVGAYANAGDPGAGIGWTSDGGGGAEAYASIALRWLEAGATILGGCCGTGPAHIAALARALGARRR